jgi:hypothetical protein
MTELTADLAADYIYQTYKVDENVLIKIFTKFGGVEVFSSPKLNSDLKRLQGALFSSKNFPTNLYLESVAKIENLTRTNIRSFGHRIENFASYDLFKRFWDISHADTVYALTGMAGRFLISNKRWGKDFWEELPMIHEENCKVNDPNNIPDHYFCEKRSIFHPDIYKEVEMEVRNQLFGIIDPQILEDVYASIMGENNESRELYAGSVLVHDNHWVPLLNDKNRTVINNIARNSLIPLEVAEVMITRHKTPMIREQIAKYTDNEQLLQTIFNSTSSEGIRKAVTENPFFKA